MKVLHLTGKDFFGAGRAAYRLHKGLLDCGIESQMWVGDKMSHDATVRCIHPGKLNKLRYKYYRNIEKWAIKRSSGQVTGMFSTGQFGFDIAAEVNKFKPDIVHIHWVNRGFLRFSNLMKIEAPVLISMHDVWTFTGGCHCQLSCVNYLTGCGNCPLLSKNSPKDISHKIIKNKEYVFDHKKAITFVGLSRWMAECAKSSYLLNNQHVVQLPNGINTGLFSPGLRDEIRLKHHFPLDKKIILFAAVDALSEPLKGFRFLSAAIDQLNPEEFELLILGGKGNENLHFGQMVIHNVGMVNNDALLRDYLSMADVVAVPSLQENLSNMIMESMACGTPVVAFNVGGNSDLITHQENGYLAKPEDVNDLVNGLKWCTANRATNEALGNNARKSTIDRFEIEKVALKYIQLYNQVRVKNR